MRFFLAFHLRSKWALKTSSIYASIDEFKFKGLLLSSNIFTNKGRKH